MALRRTISRIRTSDGREVFLRPLRKGDIDALLDFANALAGERKTNRDIGIVSLERRMKRKEEEDFLQRTLDGVRIRRTVSIAAFHGNRMVGNCDITGRKLKDVRHTGVLGIAIIDGYRGVGLGERMIRAALSQASKIGIWLVELDVFANNERARRLYNNIGFKEVGTIPQKIQRDGRLIDEVVMYIHLPHR